MLKKFKSLSAVILVLTITFNIAYADEYIPPDQFKNTVKQFNYIYNIAFNDDAPWADYKLATYYENGYGTKKDIVKAYAWYRMASANSTEFVKSLDALKTQMNAEQIAAGDKEYVKIVSAGLDQMNKNVNHTGF